MNGFHVKAKAEKFTADVSRCRQSLKYENLPSSFGRQKLHPKELSLDLGLGPKAKGEVTGTRLNVFIITTPHLHVFTHMNKINYIVFLSSPEFYQPKKTFWCSFSITSS